MRDSSPSLLGNHCLVAEMRAWCSVEGPVYLGSSSGCHFLAMSSGNLLKLSVPQFFSSVRWE